LWAHSSNLLEQSSRDWDGELWAAPGVVPSLVLELAHLQLRSLLGVGSLASSASAEAEAELPADSELYLEDEDARP